MKKKQLRIVSAKIGSPSLKRLAQKLSEKLGYKVLRSTRKVDPQRDIVFEPGLSKTVQLAAFQEKGVPCPEYFTNKNAVAPLFTEDGVKRVMCRKLTRSHSGNGCVVATKPEELVDAPLYTIYIPKKHEFRVHVFNNQVIDRQIKRKKRGYEQERDTQIRNRANGYVFCREGITNDARLDEVALKAVSALGRTYGAVDIIYNEKNNSYYVLEVNSKPGMEGTTLEKYANAIINLS